MRVPRWPRHVGRLQPSASPALAAALVVALLTVTGCGGTAEKKDAAVLERTSAGLTARLTMTPGSAVAMKPLQLSVALTDANGQPAAGRAVAFDLSMPSMTMAPNRPQVNEVGEGTYEAAAMLSMGGEWLLTVEIDTPGQPLELPFTFTAD